MDSCYLLGILLTLALTEPIIPFQQLLSVVLCDPSTFLPLSPSGGPLSHFQFLTHSYKKHASILAHSLVSAQLVFFLQCGFLEMELLALRILKFLDRLFAISSCRFISVFRLTLIFCQVLSPRLWVSMNTQMSQPPCLLYRGRRLPGTGLDEMGYGRQGWQ